MTEAGWNDWYAQAIIEQYRDKYPDLTTDEEEHIYQSSVAGMSLLFRCTVYSVSPFGFHIDGTAKNCEITGCKQVQCVVG